MVYISLCILLLQFVIDSRKAQKYLLGVFEMLVGEVHPQLMPKVPHILKAFYDNDIVEEEAVLEWADKVRETVLCMGGGIINTLRAARVTVVVPCVYVCVSVCSFLPPRTSRLQNIGMYVFTVTREKNFYNHDFH